MFIQWLKANREAEIPVTLPKVKEKVAQLFQTFGTSTIEKTCKWFLLWNNRYVFRTPYSLLSSMVVVLKVTTMLFL